MEYRNDTIAAIATPAGHGAIAIVRLTGENSVEIASKIFKGSLFLEELEGNTNTFGRIFDSKTGQDVDEVILALYRSPKSFTGEDMVEINCHGGVAIPHKILDLCLSAGARLALPGEFSKRAFLNGKIDLIQAEAINDLIHSTTMAGSSLALNNLKKGLSEILIPVKEKLTFLLSKIEAILDYPEEEIDDFNFQDESELSNSLDQIRKIIHTGKRSRKVAAGYKVVLAGRTNVGKSSLLNALAGEEKAIVSHHHGTTRDAIEVELHLNGLPVIFIDTAGIRDEFEHEIEGYGIIKTKAMLNKADLILFLSESGGGFTKEDQEILETLNQDKVLLIKNKIDLDIKKQEQDKNKSVLISAKTNEGIDVLIDRIIEILKLKPLEDTQYFVNTRQEEHLQKMENFLSETLSKLDDNETYDIVAFEMRAALGELGELLGFSVQDDVVDSIFNNFCVGK